MVQVDSPRLTVSRDLYLAILRENPSVCIERRSDGTLIVTPPTGGARSRQNSQINRQLGNWAEGGGGVVFDSNAGFELPDGSTLSPDAAWLPERRWAALSADEQRRFPPLCPDFVVELLSPSDSLREARDKLEAFMRNGARLGWLIDPFRRIVEVYRAGRDVEVLSDPQSLDGGGVLPGFVLDLSRIFSD
jgi:Uma2 family endonuclease